MNWLIGKIVPFKDQIMIGAVAVLAVMVGYYMYLAHDNENLMKIAQAKEGIVEERLNTCNTEIDIQNHAVMENAIDEAKKNAEYERALASKPKYKTKFVNQTTGDECTDLKGIIDEAMIADNNVSGASK